MRYVGAAAFSLAILTFILVGSGLAGEVSGEVEAKVKRIVEQFISEERTSDGTFLVKDEREKMTHRLSLEGVRGSVNKPGEGIYSVCVDFRDERDNNFDVDFLVRETPRGELEISDFKIHKVNGEER